MKKNGPDLNSVPKIIPGIAFRIIEGEAVLVNPENKMIYVLNHTGAFAWQKIDGKNNINKIAQALSIEYQSNISESENDLLELFEGLADRGLISWQKTNS
ncbi:MAG: PqqD family protein [Proteobacteria bacterium]|nr:PqqD family protein [Pseudomonadota bacterium]